MKKINPADVQHEFDYELQKISEIFFVMSKAVHIVETRSKNGTANQLSYPKNEIIGLMAEQSMLSAAIFWEGFISKLFVSLINQDSTVYGADLKARFNASVQEKFGRELGKQAVIELKKHLTKKQIQSSLDPKNYNLVIKNADELVEKSQRWLAAKHSSRYEKLTPAERATIDACYKMRDFLAHRSGASWASMEKTLKTRALPANYRWKSKSRHDLGAYLRASVTEDRKSRLERYLWRLRVISKKLAAP